MTILDTHSTSTSVPWTNVYGLSRSLLAFATLATLAFNDSRVLWHAATGTPDAPVCTAITARTSLFCMLPDDLPVARWLAVVVLAVVTSGWRPRLTGVLHWWISHSLVASALMVDGGDHLSATLTLLMIPLTLTDGRRWHWQSVEAVPERFVSNLRVGLGQSTLWVLRLQVAIVYLNAAAAKWAVPEWADGTALYYWFVDPAFGFTDPMRTLFGWLIDYPLTLTLATWGVLAFEFSLFGALFLRDRAARARLLVLGILFHVLIAFVHGLPSFATIMFAALILLLRRPEETWRWPALARRMGKPLFGTTSQAART